MKFLFYKFFEVILSKWSSFYERASTIYKIPIVFFAVLVFRLRLSFNEDTKKKRNRFWNIDLLFFLIIFLFDKGRYLQQKKEILSWSFLFVENLPVSISLRKNKIFFSFYQLLSNYESLISLKNCDCDYDLSNILDQNGFYIFLV